MLYPAFRSPTMVAPSGPVADTAQRKRRVELALARLSDRDIRPQFCEAVWKVEDYLAGDDELRAQALITAIHTQASLIWAVRGGYGVMRILSQVEASLSPAPSEQFFLGFSDLTALFPLLVRKGYRAIHGPVLSQVSALYARGNGGFEALMASLRAGFAGPLSFLTESATGTTSRSGTLWGGNLSLLTSTLGTQFSPDYAGSIVFVEEVSESAYRVDRMLTQMELAGVWSQAQALLVGDLGVRGSERKQVTRRLQMIQDRWGLPVLQGLPIGHFKRNACLELGREVTVAVESVSDSIDARHRVCLSWTPPRGCPP